MFQAVELTRMVVSLTGDLTIYGKVEDIDPDNPDRVPDFCPRDMKAYVNRQDLLQVPMKAVHDQFIELILH